jgi:hypothetical protein
MKVAAEETTAQPNMAETNRKLKGWQLDGLALALFVVLTVIMTWPLTPNAGSTLEQWGDALLQTWTLDWGAHILRTNPLDWANANAFYPYANTLAFTETLIGQTFLVAPIIWLTGNSVLAYNLLVLLSFVLCGWGTYLLAKEITGSRLAGLVAGTVFAFFPHRYGQLSHLHLLAAQWMPFCLLFLRRYLLAPNFKPGYAALFGLFLALELLSSTYLGLFLVTAVGMYIVYRGAIWLWQHRKSFRQNLTSAKPLGLLATLLITGVIIAPFYLPYLQVQQDLGFERSASEVQTFSALPHYYLDVPKENKLNQLVYRQLFNMGWWESSAGGERGLFLGAIALLLAAIGALFAWKKRRTDADGLFYLILAMLAVSFTFGPYWQTGRFGAIPLPYALLYNYVPGFGAIRVPVRFIYVVALGVAVLAAFGALWLQSRVGKRGWQMSLLGVGLVGLLCGEYASDVNLQNSDVLRREPPAVMRWLNERNAPTLHVPLSGSDNSNLFLQYWTRDSWRPIMNGFSGFMPPAYDALKLAVAREGFSPRIIELLQGIEIKYIVVETEDPAVKPNWSRWKADLERGATLAQTFGTTLVYELKADPWLSRLKENGLEPGYHVYFAEYRRNDPLLLELTASYLQRKSLVSREKLHGNINIGYRQLPPLLGGKAPEFLFIKVQEDPTLFGFLPEDRLMSNNLLAVYRKSSRLLFRHDLSRADALGLINRGKPLAINSASENGWNFGENLPPPTGSPSWAALHLRLGIAVLVPQKLTITRPNVAPYTVDLQPGLSVLYVDKATPGVRLDGATFTLAFAEMWSNDPPTADINPVLRPDVLLLSSKTGYDEPAKTGVAEVKIVPPGSGDPSGYTATLDVYNTPWGSHPQGHYGYWSLPVPAAGEARLDWRLNLAQKKVETKINGGDAPNYPPNPADLDITKYGNLGDFRASLNLYAGDKLVGNTRLFDFTVWTQGDKNNPANRRAGAFRGYDTGFALLVLPPKN